MENKKLKTGIILTMVGTILYALYLLVLSPIGTLPIEKSLYIVKNPLTGANGYWEIPLLFEVSYWWNLLMGPAVMVLLVYCFNGVEIAGNEPHSKNENLHDKHSAKTLVFTMKAVSGIIALSMMLLPMIIEPACQTHLIGGHSEIQNPLSSLINGIMYGVLCYICFGTLVASLFFLFHDASNIFEDKRTKTERYSSMVTKFIKIGVVETSPFVIGLSSAYIVAFILGGIVGFFKSIKISLKRSTI